MEIGETAAVIAAGGSLLLNIIGGTVALTWGLSKVRLAVKEEIDGEKSILQSKIDDLRGNMGELGMSLRAKVTEVELHLRDNYTRNDTFTRVVDSMVASMNAQFAKMDVRLDRIETKLDRVPPPNHS